jgi:hypothetical protein
VPTTPENAPGFGVIALRALLYAVLIVLLVLYAPDDGGHFIYVGFCGAGTARGAAAA